MSPTLLPVYHSFPVPQSIKIWNPCLLLFLLTITLFSSGCSSLPKTDTVTFTIPIQASLFSPDKPIEVQVWNAAQVQILEQQAGCLHIVSVSEGEPSESRVTETIQCPEGVTYQEVIPETFTIPLKEISANFQIKSQTVKVGESYQIAASGLAKDDCNSTKFSSKGTAETANVFVESPLWITTVMSCEPRIIEITPTFEP